MQAAGVFVILVREFAARVQAREDQFHATDFLFRVHVHRHAAAVVRHLDEAIALHHHRDVLRVSGQRLVDAVVDDFLHEMIGTAGVGVHARSPADRVESGQDFDGIGIVTSAHCVWTLRDSLGDETAVRLRASALGQEPDDVRQHGIVIHETVIAAGLDYTH